MHERKRQTIAAAGLFAGTLLYLLAVTAPAQEQRPEPAVEEEQPPRYTVEIIVFAYEDTSSSGNELFGPPPPLEGAPEAPFANAPAGASGEGPVFDDRTPPSAPVETGAPARPLEERPAGARIELERLEPQAFRMRDAWRKLERLDAYRPLLHAAWTQTTHGKSVTPALPLRTVSDPPLGLDGSISLYRSRFVHLDVDLALDAFSDGDARRSATDRLVRGERADAGAIGSDERTPETGAPVRYRITEDRIMRDGNVRYFDHPRFGMIARVWRVEDDDSEVPADGTPADAP